MSFHVILSVILSVRAVFSTQDMLLEPFSERLVMKAALHCGAYPRALQFLEMDLLKDSSSGSTHVRSWSFKTGGRLHGLWRFNLEKRILSCYSASIESWAAC